MAPWKELSTNVWLPKFPFNLFICFIFVLPSFFWWLTCEGKTAFHLFFKGCRSFAGSSSDYYCAAITRAAQFNGRNAANFLLALGGDMVCFSCFWEPISFFLFPPLALFNFLSGSCTFTERPRRWASQVIDWTRVAPHPVNCPPLPPPLDNWTFTNSQITSILGSVGLTKKQLVPLKENCEK